MVLYAEDLYCSCWFPCVLLQKLEMGNIGSPKAEKEKALT